ncbi:hypothetical protein N9N28_05475, partial [Rubripirellula amarantea]|nr:hypothetical protein [Rubripirellula amarantea]
MHLLSLLFLLMHPVHETVSEVEWNEQTKSVEVAVRFHRLDEEWILKQPVVKNFGDKFNAETPELSGDEASELGRRAMGYLGRHYRFKGFQDPKAIALYRWIGRKEEGAHVWWYFEVVSNDKTRPTLIDLTLLFEHNQNYTHRVVFLDQSPKTSVN